MDEMRADMGGAACVLATLLSVAQLELPINVTGTSLFLIFFLDCMIKLKWDIIFTF